MADYDWAAATTEASKAVQGSTELVKSFGSYAGDIARGPLEAIFGIIDDRLGYARGMQAISLYRKTLKRLEEAGLDTSKLRPPTPSIEIPLLEAACNEDRDELVVLWTKLLASAIAPSTRDRVRARHISILKALEPLDAKILDGFIAISLGAGRLPGHAIINGTTIVLKRSEFCALRFRVVSCRF